MKSLKNISKLFFKKVLKKKLYFLFSIFLVLSFILFNIWSQNYAPKVAQKGGEFFEVILGEKARLINPVIAKTRIDKDLVSLIFSSLLKRDEENNIKENIASYEIKDAGKKYIIKLKKNISFHDGKEMTIDDVFYTLLKIKDPELNSPLRVYFTETKLRKIDEYTLEISIPEENYYFKEVLAEVYILPKHIWEKRKYFDDENNLSPLGSGPYMIEGLQWNEGKKLKDLESLILVKNPNYWKKDSFIDKITFSFFEDSLSFLESDLYQERKEKYINLFTPERNDDLNDFKEKIINEPVDFKLTIKNNNSNKFLKNYKIRQYISKIWNSESAHDILEFKKLLLNNPDFTWDRLNKLLKFKGEIISFSVIVGGNQDNFLLNITKDLEIKLKDYGIDLVIKVVDNNEYYNKLMERDYESIISGYKTDERNLIYYFHSSQKNFPGVNIAQFNSKKVDKILLDLRKNINDSERKTKLEELKKELDSYYVLLNLDSKKSFYYLSKTIKDTSGKEIDFREYRFENMEDWILKYKISLPFLNN